MKNIQNTQQLIKVSRKIIKSNYSEANSNMSNLYQFADKGFKKRLQNLKKNRTKHMGGLIVPKEFNDYTYKDLASFMLRPEMCNSRTLMKKNYFELRGRNYYIFIDAATSKNEKLEIIQSDITEAISLLKNNSFTTTNANDNILLLSVLDFIKFQIEGLYNVLVFQENCYLPENLPGDYIEIKAKGMELLENIIHIYYNYILFNKYISKSGSSSYDKDSDKILDQFNSLIEYIRGNEIITNMFFWSSEIIDPINKLTYVNNLVTNYPNIDTVIGIPRGSTELAILFKYLFKLVYDKNVNAVIQAISFRSGKHVFAKEIGEEHFITLFKSYKKYLRNKYVLVIDDSIQSGNTVNKIRRILDKYLPNSITFTVMEATLDNLTPHSANMPIYKCKTYSEVPLKRKRYMIAQEIISHYKLALTNLVTI